MTGLPFGEWLAQNQAEVIFRVQQHFLLSIYCVAIAAVLGLLIALATYRFEWPANVAIGVIAVAFTIPAVALFGFVFSLTGNALLTIIPVVSMYGLLPITRNAVVGLQSADPGVIDAAKGMGVGAFRMLWQIRFPIAWPVILAGLRVSTQLTVGILAIGAFVSPFGLGILGFNALNNLGSVNTGNEALACVVFVAAVALLFDAFFVLIRRFTTPRGARV
ncbi:MAG: ABC transporter permease subunit [Actinobacteria bacterium]|nr:ABC transporter permease subunit [Actinomycetota bacterium]